ncbi:hypothetical protein MYSTI_03220 [Myxococcus stipitatus DSM 14675]|uniref:Uncharacterized protein n=1 Tax=Myxococcus stipitatus (strain DSM 14675 / JCM 12634 / Mx s8) TaxID=1278073 RepID=L7U8W1_MYXSD|nr:hypothetical protein [Myxococcus stipitatus]AGC44533.1 hypothetical protein MYSTI_03220 [Myxococcus stipitatus DSM 14675]
MTTPRENPCVSVNQLGQYLTGTPSLRKRIIQAQKNPVDPQYLRYPAAAQAITEYLCEGRDEVILRYHQRRLLNAQPESDFDAHRLALCAEALHRCLATMEELAVHAIASPADQDPAPLEVAGVAIKVKPEVLLRGVDARGHMRSGVLKLYFSKHTPLDERAGEYIATVLQRFAEERLEQRGPVDPRLVGVFDVFAGRLFVAPRAQQRRLNDVALACEEIAGRWDRN